MFNFLKKSILYKYASVFEKIKKNREHFLDLFMEFVFFFFLLDLRNLRQL